MFEIYGGQKSLKQWSKNQRLVVNELPLGAEVRFYNDVMEEHPLQTAVYDLIEESGKIVRVCDIPNTLLRKVNVIKVCIPEKIDGLYGNLHTLALPRERYIFVEPAEKPNDYIYIETELDSDYGRPSGSNIEISDEQLKSIIDKAVAEAIMELELSDEKIEDIIAKAVSEAVSNIEISDAQLTPIVDKAVAEAILKLELSDETIESIISEAVSDAVSNIEIPDEQLTPIIDRSVSEVIQKAMIEVDEKLEKYVLTSDLGVITAADVAVMLAK